MQRICSFCNDCNCIGNPCWLSIFSVDPRSDNVEVLIRRIPNRYTYSGVLGDSRSDELFAVRLGGCRVVYIKPKTDVCMLAYKCTATNGAEGVGLWNLAGDDLKETTLVTDARRVGEYVQCGGRRDWRVLGWRPLFRTMGDIRVDGSSLRRRVAIAKLPAYVPRNWRLIPYEHLVAFATETRKLRSRDRSDAGMEPARRRERQRNDQDSSDQHSSGRAQSDPTTRQRWPRLGL